MADEYFVEFEITETKVSTAPDGSWKRHRINGEGTPLYSGFSTGQNPVKGIENLKAGDNVRLRCEDVESKDGKTTYHNILEILDVGVAPPSKKSDTPLPKGEGAPFVSPDARQESIEKQVAVKSAIELVVGGVLSSDHPIVSGALAWIAEKLGVKDITDIPTPTTAPKPVESPPDASGDNQKKEVVVDMAMLRNLFLKMKMTNGRTWTDTTAMFWIERQFGIERKETLEETILLLTPEQRKKFIDHVSIVAGVR